MPFFHLHVPEKAEFKKMINFIFQNSKYLTWLNGVDYRDQRLFSPTVYNWGLRKLY